MRAYTLLQKLLYSRKKFRTTIVNIRYKITVVLFIFLFSALNAFASPPECPLYSTKRECLASVEENFRSLLDFIEKEYIPPQEQLVEAANEIKKYESLACQKTCMN